MLQQQTESSPQPIQALMSEHELINKVLDSLEKWSESLLLDTHEDRLTLAKFLTFFREFADAAHHIKEEKVLFEVMTRHGFAIDQGPLAVMMHEHGEARDLLRTLAVLEGQASPWTKEVCQEVSDEATTYVTLMRNHIDKENQVLYPMAANRLPPEQWKEIADAFANIDEEHQCSGLIDENVALANQLIAIS